MSNHVTLPRLSRSLDEVRSQVFGFVEGVQDTMAAKGFLPARLNLNRGVVRGLLEIFCWGEWQIYGLLGRLLQQAAPYYSTGDWLDLHADSVGLTRRAATKAKGIVTFYRGTASDTTNISIPAGRIVRTLPDGTGAVYRYVTTEDAVLPAGSESVAVPCEAEDYGAAGNASSGQICELVTPVVGIGSVSNPTGWLTGEGFDDFGMCLQESILCHINGVRHIAACFTQRCHNMPLAALLKRGCGRLKFYGIIADLA